MLRSSLCLLLTAVFASAALAQQGHTDVQSLQYEFGKDVRVHTPIPKRPPIVTPPCPCETPVVHAPVKRQYQHCCTPVYTECRPCYTPRRPAMHRRALLRAAYCSPYHCGCW